MSWLADILKPQPKPAMPIELANVTTTNPAPAQTTTPEPAAVVIESMHPRLHTADTLSTEEVERHLFALSQPRLQGLAQRVAAARSRLLDLTAAAEALSMAVDATHFTGIDPEHWLQNDLAEVQAQIEQTEAGRKRADERRVARSARVAPLTTAVGRPHTKLVRERDVLTERVRLLRKGTGVDSSPVHHLRQAGLTSEQIAALGPLSQGEKDLANFTSRLEESAPKIAVTEAWQSSGYRDHHHLEGLGFDALIEASQPVDEEVAP